jgi:hypothetical protein
MTRRTTKRDRDRDAKSQTAVSPSQPPRPFEQIFGCRKSASGSPQYLVTQTRQSYHHSSWFSADDLQCHSYGAALLTRFFKSSTSFPSSPPFYEPLYDQIDRVIDSREGEYRVKWMNLGYEDTTWETDVPAEALARSKSPSISITHLPRAPFEKLCGLKCSTATASTALNCATASSRHSICLSRIVLAVIRPRSSMNSV